MLSKDKNYINNALELIGNTPLIKLNKITEKLEGSFFAKHEASNPGHSNKDRISIEIVNQAEKEGLLKPGSTVIETTSGNTGFSLSMVCAVRGYKCVLAVTSKASPDKIDMLKSMGAKVYVCPSNVSADNPKSYYEVAKKLNKKIKNSIYINQYFNQLNPLAHYKTTGPEIWNQTKGKITHLVASSGTGGTISGVGKFLKEKNPAVKIIGVDAFGSLLKSYHETGKIDKSEIYPYKIEGMGKNLVPSTTHFDTIDLFEKVRDKESAICSREIACKEGLFVGYTSGAVLQATKQLSNRKLFNKISVVVMIFCDHVSKYMSKIYSDDWMINQGFLNKNNMNLDNDVEYIN